MATEDRVLKSSLAVGDGAENEHAAERKSRRAERARAPVPLSHQVAGHKYGIHKVGQLTRSSNPLYFFSFGQLRCRSTV